MGGVLDTSFQKISLFRRFGAKEMVVKLGLKRAKICPRLIY